MSKHKKGNTEELRALQNLIPERHARIDQAPAIAVDADAIKELTGKLHPHRQFLRIDTTKTETDSTKTFRLIADAEKGTTGLAVFRAGQYLSVKADVNGVNITRPYSISSSPKEAREDGFYEITIRKMPGGFLTEYVWENWKAGDPIVTSGPEGFFYHEPLRDCKHVVGLAGGSGVTPFRSMIKDIIDDDLDLKMTLLYGTRCPDDIIFGEELMQLNSQAPEKISVHIFCSEPDDSWQGASGFLTNDTIQNIVGDVRGKSFFISGPPAMYLFLEKELKAFDLRKKMIRWEAFGEFKDFGIYPDFPQDLVDKIFKLTVKIGGQTQNISAKTNETILVAMERARIAPPSKCRSGECGFCRSRLVAGDIYVRPQNDGRRLADHKFGYFHPCASYPASDLKIEVPRDV
jgi:ferredoxin-NADP reductase